MFVFAGAILIIEIESLFSLYLCLFLFQYLSMSSLPLSALLSLSVSLYITLYLSFYVSQSLSLSEVFTKHFLFSLEAPEKQLSMNEMFQKNLNMKKCIWL